MTTEAEPDLGPPMTDWLQAHMFARRVVLLNSDLDDLEATGVATQLMTLDGSGDEGIHLHINSAEGTLTAALTLMDTISALGVPVEAVCTGRAEGPALGVLAIAGKRLGAPHSSLRLHDPGFAAEGTGQAMSTALEEHRRQLDRFIEMVATATKQPAERVEVDLASGRHFDAHEAIDYRLIDGLWTRS
jgi:ATP-dependent Clp protease protease subunit